MGLFYRIMYIVIAIIGHVVGGSLVISAFRDNGDSPTVLGISMVGLVGLAIWLMFILASFWFFEMLFLYDWSIG